MAQQEDQSKMMERINKSVDARLGPNQSAQQPAAPAPAQPPATDAPTQKTDAQQAAEIAAPKDDADASQEQPFYYSVKEGETEHQFTPDQILGMRQRLAQSNAVMDDFGPVMGMAAKLAKVTGKSPREVAPMMAQMIAKAMRPNQPVGKQGEQPAQPQGATAPSSNEDIDAQLKAWEEENAVSAPPGFRDFLKSQQTTQSQMGQMQQLLQQVLQASKQGLQATGQSAEQNSQQRADLVRERIGVNFDRAQSQLGLPDEDANAFRQFYRERGFDDFEFTSYPLTMRVMQDFKNAKNSGELERLIETNQRRSAFTGTLAPSAGGGSAAPQNGQSDPAAARLSSMVDSAMAKKFPT